MFVILFTNRPGVFAFLNEDSLFRGKGFLTAKKIQPQRKVFLALLYPSGYNNRWKSFEPQNFSAFVPQHGIFPVGRAQLSV